MAPRVETLPYVQESHPSYGGTLRLYFASPPPDAEAQDAVFDLPEHKET